LVSIAVIAAYSVEFLPGVLMSAPPLTLYGISVPSAPVRALVALIASSILLQSVMEVVPLELRRLARRQRAFPVSIVMWRNGQPLGTDKGVLSFEGSLLHFQGERTAFAYDAASAKAAGMGTDLVPAIRSAPTGRLSGETLVISSLAHLRPNMGGDDTALTAEFGRWEAMPPSAVPSRLPPADPAPEVPWHLRRDVHHWVILLAAIAFFAVGMLEPLLQPAASAVPTLLVGVAYAIYRLRFGMPEPATVRDDLRERLAAATELDAVTPPRERIRS